MYPALPAFYLETSLTSTASPLFQHWAGHCVQMSPMPVGGFLGCQTPSYSPAQMVWNQVGLQRPLCPVLIPFTSWHMLVKGILEAE